MHRFQEKTAQIPRGKVQAVQVVQCTKIKENSAQKSRTVGSDFKKNWWLDFLDKYKLYLLLENDLL